MHSFTIHCTELFIPYHTIHTVSYNILKKTIDALKSQVYGADDASTSSVGSGKNKRKCGFFISIFMYCFGCCFSTHDQDVIEAHEETMTKPHRSGLLIQKPSSTPPSVASAGHPHYASPKNMFRLNKTAKKEIDTLLLLQSARKLSAIDDDQKAVLQPLINTQHNSYSPPRSGSPKAMDRANISGQKEICTSINQTAEEQHLLTYDDEEEDGYEEKGDIAMIGDQSDHEQFDENVQGYIARNKMDKKQIAIGRWNEIIQEESNKVNKFYLNIERQLLTEYEQILSKLDKLYQLLQGKYQRDSMSHSDASHSIIEPSKDHRDPPSLARAKSRQRLYEQSPITDVTKKGAQLLQPLKIPKKYQKRNIHLYQMKLNIFILYQRFIALSNFRTLNQIGFKKILKKFDKNMKTFQQKKLMKDINAMDFIESNQCTECMNDLIKAYSNLFEGGDFHAAKVKLLESISWSAWSVSSSFKVGLKIGVLLGLIVWVISALIVNEAHDNLPSNAVYAYRSIGCFLAFLWFWSGNIYIWSKYRINYVFIFEFEPRTRLTFLQYFDEAATLSLFYFVNTVLFLKTAGVIPSRYLTIWPTTLVIFFILRLFLPVFDYWKSRQCIIDAIYQTIIAPFGRVRFRDFFMGDVLTSLVKVIADLYMALCILSTSQYFEPNGTCITSTFSAIIKPICICAPYWFRFAQCLNRYFNTHDRIPHLPNAAKYGTAMSVTLLGTLHSNYGTLNTTEWSPGRIIWLITTISSTCYLIFWDLYMDWSLFKKNRISEYPKYWYGTAMATDICLRYLWTFTLFPTAANPYFHESFKYMDAATFLAFIEIAELLRRSIWAIFRVENAHVSRKDQFRSYEYVPLFYEHTSLIEQQRKSNKPTSMIVETITIFLLVLVVTIVIVLTSK